MEKNDVVINLENASYTYKSDEAPTIKNVNLEVRKGEFIGLVGPTGSGKTTLLNMIAGVVPHYFEGLLEGTVSVMGKPTIDMSMAEISKTVGLVMQDPEAQLFNLFVRDEIIWGLENLGVPREEIAEMRDTAAEFFRVSHLLDRVTYDLSGGEKQLVAITSTFIMKPKIMLFDNPTSQLDPLGSQMVFEALARLMKENDDITVIVNEDKIEELAAYTDRLWLIKDGEIKIDAEPKEFFACRDELSDALIRIPPVTDVAFNLRSNQNWNGQLPFSVDKFVKIYNERKSSIGES